MIVAVMLALWMGLPSMGTARLCQRTIFFADVAIGGAHDRARHLQSSRPRRMVWWAGLDDDEGE
jgi:hypothetical protein